MSLEVNIAVSTDVHHEIMGLRQNLGQLAKYATPTECPQDLWDVFLRTIGTSFEAFQSLDARLTMKIQEYPEELGTGQAVLVIEGVSITVDADELSRALRPFVE